MILILVILKMALINGEAVQHDFRVLKDQGVDLVVSESSLISSIFKPSRMKCMAACSSNSNCVTAVYDNSKGMVRNCFLYNRKFCSNELIPSTNSILYEKKSKSSLSSTTKEPSTTVDLSTES